MSVPSMHIPEAPFTTLVDEYGYEGAKERVQELVREEAGEVSTNE